jgi:hypothetical protein
MLWSCCLHPLALLFDLLTARLPAAGVGSGIRDGSQAHLMPEIGR